MTVLTLEDVEREVRRPAKTEPKPSRKTPTEPVRAPGHPMSRSCYKAKARRALKAHKARTGE